MRWKLVTMVVALSLSVPALATTSQYGSAADARAMLARAIAAIKQNEAKALAMFNSGSGGFKDRDLYVICANASSGVITASPTSKGKLLQSFPPGEKVMTTAQQGKVSEITYFWPRPGSITPLKKHTFYTKVANQICGVGYWE
jgi:hypothetical protein